MADVIIKKKQRAVMMFIATANRGGYRPTGQEVNEYRVQPDRKRPRRGALLEAAVVPVPERRVRKGSSGFDLFGRPDLMSQIGRAHQAQWATNFNNFLNPSLSSGIQEAFAVIRAAGLGLQVEYEIIPGTPGRPARYAPDKPGEKFLAHLRRLGWIERDSRGGYCVTLLGHALLKAEAETDQGGKDASVVVLAAEDELAYGRVLGVIADCGDALIVDGYLNAEELVHLLRASTATRFLVGMKLGPSRVAQLALQIGSAPPTDDGVVRELRRTDLHDRYVIGDHKVYGLGASLNGVRKGSMTTLVEMPDVAARTIRAEAERLWDAAEVVAQTGQFKVTATSADSRGGEPDEQKKGRSSPGDSGVTRDGDRFRHGACTVRHRSQQAAERCARS